MTVHQKPSNYSLFRFIFGLMKTFFKTLILFALAVTAYGQATMRGKVLNGSTNEPIAYANIGIANSNVGTLSNLDGSFFFLVPSHATRDSLTFSALGFDKKIIPLNSFSGDHQLTIILNERAIELESIEVTNRRQKNRTFEVGNKEVRGGVLETDTLYAGGSVSLLIENAHEKELEFPVYLQTASLRIFKNNLASLKFRVRIIDVDQATGEPGRDLFHESLIMESTMRKGWLTFDFSKYSFVVHKPFFITFEQILDVNDRTKIADGYREFMEKHPDKLEIDTVVFEGKKQVRKMIKGSGIDLPGTFIAISPRQSDNFTCYERDTSLGKWKKVRGIVTALVTLSDQLPAVSERH
jgi:hypothetical protein